MCSKVIGAPANIPRECDRWPVSCEYENEHGHDSDALLEGGGESEEDIEKDGKDMRTLFDESGC